MNSRAGAAAVAATAALAFAASTVVFWPGVAVYDSVEQYRQALSGRVGDWHPPAMARLWGALAQLWPGTAPMLVLQLGLYWLGLGLLAAALARRGRIGTGFVALLLGTGPILSCWMGVIVKDAQMTGALAAAVGIAAWHPLADKPRPAWATAAAVLLLAYATLVRANAAFATVPLALAMLGWGKMRGGWSRAALCAGLILAVLALAPLVNRGLLHAYREGAENSLLLYDIAGTSIRAGADSAGVPAARWAALAKSGCYSPMEWDAFSEPGPCTIAPGLAAQPDTPPLYGLWLRTLAAHPFSYAAHRLAHFNMTMRWLVPPGGPGAVGPVESEPNRLGLGAAPTVRVLLFQELGFVWASLPTGWPALWLALAVAGLWAARRAPPGPERAIARGLFLSAAVGGLSYAVVSVASDLRYHLWTILPAGLGLLLLWSGGGIGRRQLAILLATALLVVGPGTAARLLFPLAATR